MIPFKVTAFVGDFDFQQRVELIYGRFSRGLTLWVRGVPLLGWEVPSYHHPPHRQTPLDRRRPTLCAAQCRANMAHIRQSKPNFGLGFRAKILQLFRDKQKSLNHSRSSLLARRRTSRKPLATGCCVMPCSAWFHAALRIFGRSSCKEAHLTEWISSYVLEKVISSTKSSTFC